MAPSNLHHPSTRALHADDHLNRVTDVAPPIHLSTTFRFPDNPDDLIPSVDPVVCLRISQRTLSYTTTPRLRALSGRVRRQELHLLEGIRT